MTLKAVVLTVLVTALAGCAAPQMSLTKQAQTNIDQVEAVLTIPQSNLDVTVPATNPGANGILGALIVAAIDSSRQSSAKREAAPILGRLRNYDFRTEMLNATTDALIGLDKLSIAMPLRVEVVASDSSKRIAFDQSMASVVLFCHVGYRLESGNLIASASAEMYPKSESLKTFRQQPDETNPLAGGNAIYRKVFTFSKQAVNSSTIKRDLSEAASNLAHQLAADLNHAI